MLVREIMCSVCRSGILIRNHQESQKSPKRPVFFLKGDAAICHGNAHKVQIVGVFQQHCPDPTVTTTGTLVLVADPNYDTAVFVRPGDLCRKLDFEEGSLFDGDSCNRQVATWQHNHVEVKEDGGRTVLLLKDTNAAMRKEVEAAKQRVDLLRQEEELQAEAAEQRDHLQRQEEEQRGEEQTQEELGGDEGEHRGEEQRQEELGGDVAEGEEVEETEAQEAQAKGRSEPQGKKQQRGARELGEKGTGAAGASRRRQSRRSQQPPASADPKTSSKRQKNNEAASTCKYRAKQKVS